VGEVRVFECYVRLEDIMKEVHMKRLVLMLGLITLLGGCALASETYTADGRKGYSISCSGSALNWGMCYEKAGEICEDRGYVVLEKSGDKGFAVSGTQYGLYGGSVMNRSMIVRCKD
jgi:hypothetical protein